MGKYSRNLSSKKRTHWVLFLLLILKLIKSIDNLLQMESFLKHIYRFLVYRIKIVLIHHRLTYFQKELHTLLHSYIL